jgi:hypothetical protein
MRKLIGYCGVDSGMLMIIDPCYVVGKDSTMNEYCDSWKKACEEIFCVEGHKKDDPYDVYKLGIAVDTTYGDGTYPVYLETTKNGKRRVIVELDY